MDFLSTPMPATCGTEENFEKQKISPHWWTKDVKQSEQWVAQRCAPKYTFGGKGAKEWAKILNSDYWTTLEHIKNGTMNQYHTYLKWRGEIAPKRNQDRVKRFMTPIGVMTYVEAKEAFGFNQSETIRNRLRSEDPRWSNWYFLEEA